jgi:hypothetical protein
MNRMAIDLSNMGVAEMKKGDLWQAFSLLSNSANIIAQQQSHHQHKDASAVTYRYHWEDCASSILRRLPELMKATAEGNSSFLYLKLLRVSPRKSRRKRRSAPLP